MWFLLCGVGGGGGGGGGGEGGGIGGGGDERETNGGVFSWRGIRKRLTGAYSGGGGLERG